MKSESIPETLGTEALREYTLDRMSVHYMAPYTHAFTPSITPRGKLESAVLLARIRRKLKNLEETQANMQKWTLTRA